MIPNFPDAEKLIGVGLMIRDLNNDLIAYYLTGSRFFGGVNNASDWDFFTQHSDSTEQTLRYLGFQPVNEVGERDKLIVSSWIYRQPNFHIMLVSDVELKLEAQNYLFKKYGKPVTKYDADFWNQTYDLILANPRVKIIV